MTVVRNVKALASAGPEEILGLIGELNRDIAETFAHHWNAQTVAWDEQIHLLRDAAKRLHSEGFGDGLFVFEYEIPRRSRRPDVVLVTSRAIVVIEFKVGSSSYDSGSRWQVAEYALDLRDFHSASADMGIACVLVATRAPDVLGPRLDERGLPLFLANSRTLVDTLVPAVKRAEATLSSPTARSPALWLEAKYRPTPNIIEAAERLYKGHGVAEINHSHAHNLTATTETLVNAIEGAATRGERVICFVTGVPGAGKTLTGLDAVHDPRLRQAGRPPGVFLSGNRPLVEVLQEALASSGKHETKKESARTVRTFIQGVHRFVAEHANDGPDRLHEHVVVFDEAQRAWSRDKMARKQRGAYSEPEQILAILERVPDWAVLVALVGGGQEIHDGEAGLASWGDALAHPDRKPWKVLASPEVLAGGTSVSGHRLFEGSPDPRHRVVPQDKLHLDVSVRSPRARLLAEWVDSLLREDEKGAARAAAEITEFPIVATRDQEVMKTWLRTRTMDGQRAGLVASAGARRLRAYGIQLSTKSGQNSMIAPWFLAPPDDVRSSSFLEVAATEFECQGLELDYVGLCWGDDLTRGERGWAFRKFIGTAWRDVQTGEEQAFMLNKHRVLLTRARKGLVIWVPRGDPRDATRDPMRMDRVWEFLLACGVRSLDVAASDHAPLSLIGSDV